MTTIPPDEFVPPDPPQPSPDEPTDLLSREWALVVSCATALVLAALGGLAFLGVIPAVPSGADVAVGAVLEGAAGLFVAAGRLIRGRDGAKHGVYSERTVYRIDPAATRR